MKMQIENWRLMLRSLKPLKGAAARRDTVRAQMLLVSLNPRATLRKLVLLRELKLKRMKMQIENWRWAGVPFYIRTGKCMERRLSEVVIQFKEVPHWTLNVSKKNRKANRIVIRLQPDESIQLLMQIKQPGPKSLELKQVPLTCTMLIVLMQDYRMHMSVYCLMLLKATQPCLCTAKR